MNGPGTFRSTPSTYTPDIDDTRANASIWNDDPFKFSHGLTGVDQQTNFRLVHILLLTILVPTIFVACFRCSRKIRADRRRQAMVTPSPCLDIGSRNRDTLLGYLKNHLLYALTSSKDKRDVAAIIGRPSGSPLPTRLQTAIVCIYVLSNFAYCLAIPNLPRAQRFAALRGRCGTFATFNLVLTILFALRNNPLIWLLHVSYDTFNFFHRWTARIVVLQSVVHVFAFSFNAYHVTYDGKSGWQNVTWVLRQSLSYRWGLTAGIVFALMTVLAIGPLRHAFYDMFLALHRLGAFIAMAGIYFHIGQHALPQLPWVYLTIGFLVSEHLIRTVRILRANFAWKERTWTRATLEALPGEATRVTFALPQAWRTSPGSHVHIYLPRIALWSSHPFSIAWVESSGYARLAQEKLPSSHEDLRMERGPSTVSCVIRARNGMTRSLYKLASSEKADSMRLWGAVEGPYGGYHSLDSYKTVVLFAAGVGITHQLSFVRHLLEGYTNNTVAAQKILLVWCVTTIDAIEWVSPWLAEITAMPDFHEVIRLRLHVSKMTAMELAGQRLPRYLDLRAQRCDPQEGLDEYLLSEAGAVAVSVCGPPDFSASVRAAVRRSDHGRGIDLFDESFTY